MKQILKICVAFTVVVEILGAQPFPAPIIPNYLGISMSPVFLTHIPDFRSIRIAVSGAGEKNEVSIYFNKGKISSKSEQEYGIQYRRHFKGYAENTFSFGVDASRYSYSSDGDRVHSLTEMVQFGPRSAYTINLRPGIFIRPQIGFDFWLGVFGSKSERETTSIINSDVALPIIAIMPDIQIEIGWQFSLLPNEAVEKGH
jgi:hypothetical protein